MPSAIEIPAGLGFKSRKFQLGYKQQITPGSSGFTQTIDRSIPVWYAEYQTPPMNDARYSAAAAFIDALEGSLYTFLAYDPAYQMPIAYKNSPIASDPWTQTGQTAPRVTATSYSNSTLTLDRLQNGAIITPGDRICFYDGKAWWLFRARSAHVVSGNTATVTVGPRPITPNALPQNIRYRRPVFEAKIIGAVEETGDVNTPVSLGFKCFQFIGR